MRVLIVEDEALSAMMLESKIRSAGFEPLKPAATGEAAIEAARASRPEAILMDIRLAGPMDGIEAAGRILAEAEAAGLPRPRLVFMSGYQDEEYLSRAAALRPEAFLPKPLDLSALLVRLRD